MEKRGGCSQAFMRGKAPSALLGEAAAGDPLPSPSLLYGACAGSVRALVFNNTVQHKEPVYALVCQTLKCTTPPPPPSPKLPSHSLLHTLPAVKQVLEEVLRAAGFFNKQKQVCPSFPVWLGVGLGGGGGLTKKKTNGTQEMARQKWLVYAMVYDLLMGKGLVGGGRLGATVLKYKTCIKAEFERMKVKYTLFLFFLSLSALCALLLNPPQSQGDDWFGTTS